MSTAGSSSATEVRAEEQPAAQPGMTSMRLATWNVWWRFADWRRRQDAIRDVLAVEQPDVCGLQEVWATPDACLAEILARDLGMHWAWSPSPAPRRWQERAAEPDVAIGNAVLSRFPIHEEAVLDLPPGTAPTEGRTALYTRLAMPTGSLPFVTTQLNSAPQHSAIRCDQVRALHQLLATRSTAGQLPPVVAGDLNSTPHSDEVRLLGGHQTAPPVAGQVLVDAWLYADPRDHGHTWDRANPFVRATGEPGGRIDYLLLGTPSRGGALQVRSVRLFGAQPVDGQWASDHAGVIADVAIAPSDAKPPGLSAA